MVLKQGWFLHVRGLFTWKMWREHFRGSGRCGLLLGWSFSRGFTVWREHFRGSGRCGLLLGWSFTRGFAVWRRVWLIIQCCKWKQIDTGIYIPPVLYQSVLPACRSSPWADTGGELLPRFWSAVPQSFYDQVRMVHRVMTAKLYRSFVLYIYNCLYISFSIYIKKIQ